MTTPTTSAPARPRPGRRAANSDSTPEPTPVPTLAPPPRMRRRPLVIVAAIAAVCLGALLGLMAFNSVSNAHEVVVVRQTVNRGQEIARDNLMTVRMGVDPAVRAIPGAELESLVGKRAALDLAAGGVITPEQVTADPMPASGSSIVGLSLTSAMLPANQLRHGDQVRVVITPGPQGSVDETSPETIVAIVVGLAPEANTGNTIVNLQVPHGTAPRVAAIASTGKVAVVLDSQE